MPSHQAESWSMRTVLLVSVVVMVILTTGISTKLIVGFSNEQVASEYQIFQQQAANTIARRLSETMVERKRDLLFLRTALSKELAHLGSHDPHTLVTRFRDNYPDFSWVGLVQKDGEIVIGTDGLLVGKNIANRDWFEQGKKGITFMDAHPAFLLQPYLPNDDGSDLYLLDIAMPLYNQDGTLWGVLGSHLNWKMMEGVVEQAKAALANDKQIDAMIINGDGKVVYDTGDWQGSLEPILKQKNGATQSLLIDNDSNRYLASLAHAPAIRSFDGLGWKVLLRQSEASIAAGAKQLQQELLIWVVGIALAFLFAGMVIVHRATKPLERIIGKIEAFDSNATFAPDIYQRSKISEISRLQQTFHDMASRVMSHTDELKKSRADIIHALARAGEHRDNETGNHVNRMSFCCEHLARLAGIDNEAANNILLASQMHDLGKIGIPDHILLKPGRFEPEERAIMETHCEIGAFIIGDSTDPLIRMAKDIVLSHHEKWDGSGYPNQLQGEAIPIEGRISALCDVFDALLSSRPYKKGWEVERVRSFIEEQSGKHFDPNLAKLFLDNFDKFLAIRELFLDSDEDENRQTAN